MSNIQDEIKYYEQKYFSNDEPIPFIDDLYYNKIKKRKSISFYESEE